MKKLVFSEIVNIKNILSVQKFLFCWLLSWLFLRMRIERK